MIIEHIKASDLTTNKWSGGTTTQLAIYPENADYKKLDFLFRISTATVEAEESVFTKLPGISRKLMILDGEIKIEHKNHHSKILKKFDQDSFSGNWDTKSFGKAIDFNLMTKDNTTGAIKAISFNDSFTFSIEKEVNYCGIYIYKGEVILLNNSKSIIAHKGDVINIYNDNELSKLQFKSTQDCEVILTKISL